VAHAEGVPFLVHSGAVTARVLGTRFLLRHDAGTSHTRVAVTDGKILVNAHAAGEVGQTLTAGHIADVIDSTMRTSSMDDLTPGTEWVQGKLVFYHVPVSTVLATLSRWYGYQFRYADSSLSQRSVTIAVSMQSSATALATLEQILSVNVVVKGDTVVLAPQPSPAERGNPQSRNYDVWMPTREVGR
jgi:ferric-dicitrate binding protein FerR (iron transport regulator)